MHTIDPIELELTLPQGRMASQYWGIGTVTQTSPTCIALHGWLDNGASFAVMAQYLHELLLEQGVGLQLYCIDFAGHGHSFHRPPGVNYNIWDYAIDILHLTQQLDLKKYLLLGHSMGAGIAPLIAAIVPEQVTGLVLIEGLGPLTGGHDTAVLQLVHWWKQEQQEVRPAKLYHSLTQAVEIRMRGRWPLTRKSAELLVKRSIRECDGGFCWRSDRRLTLPSSIYLQELQVEHFLRAVAAPVDLVIASEGLTANHTLWRHRACKVADIKIHQLEGSHHLHLDTAAQYCSLLIQKQLWQDY